ncbi:TetR/AcrR family transcriptional regulator [Arthrobacter sp. PsM3]|uniref:TetR/AcrR family transcriptional regulator n=1 Tax=Arthrobacter sp. PsM3 TaxID=3030531 RepID=UPI00263B3AD4|nr:TetR/AcrR family transcriptional regulator [Arthrobacter sp. PsM3]MDN4646513.1 TetR/AcrR family transcriptional regulator [Arthrobacter sp. PsM3]
MEKTTRRAVQAAGTRDAIVEAAGRLFAADGYVRTTIDGIAAESGVAVQTVYNSVGNKAALLSAVLDRAAAGPGAQAGVLDFMRERTRRAADLDALVAVLADWFVEVHPRTAGINAVIARAAAVDEAAARLETDRAQQRLRRYEEAAAAARARGGLSSGMSDAEGAAAIWSLGHPQTYRALVQDAGWSVPAYRAWVAKALAAALA